MSSDNFDDGSSAVDAPEDIARISAQSKMATLTIRALSPDAFRAVCVAVREVIATQPDIIKSAETVLNRIYKPEWHEPPTSSASKGSNDGASAKNDPNMDIMARLRSCEKIQTEISHFTRKEWALAAGHIMVQTRHEALRHGVSNDRADMLSEQIGLNVLKMHNHYSLS